MEPILFNPQKHHLAAIVAAIVAQSKQGEANAQMFLEGWAESEGLVDLYYGKLSVEQIEKEVFDFLQQNQLLTIEAYRQYLEKEGQIKRRGHYAYLTLSDTSIMTLRLLYDPSNPEDGFVKVHDPRHFVHVHPARYSPNTFRVRANTLKTAIVAYFLALCRHIQPHSLELVNDARAKLQLAPIPEIPSAISEMLQYIEKANAL